MNRGAHGVSSLMLSTLVLSNENRLFAFVRKEAPASLGGGGCHPFFLHSYNASFFKTLDTPFLTDLRSLIARIDQNG